MKTLAARLGLLAFAGVVGGLPLTRAADDAPAADDAVPHAREIRQLTERMGWRQKTQQGFSRDFQEMGGFTKGDLQLVTAEYQGFIDGFQKAINAYRQGEVETARELAKEAEKARESREWGRRFQARREQSQNWPDEKWAEEMQTKWGGARTRAFGAEWVQSRRRASAAWGRYAESIAPGIERRQQLALEDAAFLAEAGVRSTEERWRIRQTLDDRLWDKTVTSEEVEKKIREFEQLGEKATEIIKQRAESDRLWREWQRARTEAERDVAETFRATWEQQEKRKTRRP